MATGLITRKEIIEDEALKWGAEYAKQTQLAIEKNKEFIAIVLALKEANDKLRNSPNVKSYNDALQRTNQLGQQATTVWKEQDQAERALLSTKRKNQLATESTNRALIQERTVLAATNAEIKRQTVATGILGKSYKELAAKMAISSDKVKNIIATGKLATESQAQYNVRLKQAQTEFQKLNTRVRSADAAVGQFNRNVGNYPQQAVTGLKSLISAFGVTTGIYLFAKVMKDAFNVAKDFEKQNATLSAVLQVEKEQMKGLRDQAKALGESTVKTAGEVTELQVAYARLGFSQQQILDMTEATISGSIAMNSNLAETAELVGAVVNSFDDFSSTSAPEIIDIMSLATAKSALNFEKLQTAIPIAAGAANAVGIPFTRLVALFGKLSDAGIDASSSATALRNIFIESASQNLTYDQVIEKIKNSTDKLTAANDEFGKRGAVSASIISANIDKVEELDKALQGAAGTSGSMANKELATLDGAVKLLGSAWQGLILDVTDANGANNKLASGVTFIANNLKTIFTVLTYSAAAWVAYKTAVLLANVQTRLLALTTLQATAAQEANVIVTGFGATAQTANAAATTLATTAWQRFNIALKANILGLVAAALIAVVYAFDSFNKSMKEASDEVKNNTDSFLSNRDQMSKSSIATRTLTDRYEELEKKAKKLGGETKLTTEEQKEMQRITTELAKIVPGAVKAVNQYGEALKLNTDLLKKYNVENAKILEIDKKKAIKEEISLQKELSEEIKRKTKNLLNFKKQEGQGSISTEFITEKERELSVMKVDLILSQGRLKAINGITEAEKEAIKVSDEKSKKIEVNAVRTIEVIDAEIKAQQDLVKTLSDKTGKEGNAVKAKIKALEAEKNLIFSNDKAEKKTTDDRLKRLKDVKDALYQLSQFRYENEININKKIIDNDKSTTQQRLDALREISQLSSSKNDETLQKELLNNALAKEGVDKYNKQKLESYIKYSEDRATLILNGKIPTQQLTTQEQLIYEKYFANIKDLREKDAADVQKIIDDEVAAIQKRTDAEIQLKNNQKNKDVVTENNRYADELESAEGNFKLIESAREEHERRILAIQKKYALEAIQLQIEDLQGLLDNNDAKEVDEQISAEKRAEIVSKLEQYKRDASDLTLEDFKSSSESFVDAQKDLNDKLIDLGMNLKDALSDLTNAIFDARIANIDREIERNNEYYDNEIEKAGNNERQKKLIEEEREKKNAELEKKRKKEAYKAAVFNKVMALAEIAMNTAISISKVAGQTGIGAAFLIPGFIALGALQAATVLATPLPKYKMGRKDGPDEFAVVGDGGRREVVSDHDGSNPEITPSTPTITFLKKKQRVHRSIDAYKEYMRNATLGHIENKYRKVQEFTANISVQNDFTELEKRIESSILKGFKSAKIINKNFNSSSSNFGDDFWRFKNTNW